MKTFKKVIIPVTASALLLGACGNSATDSKEDTIISSKAGDVKVEDVMDKLEEILAEVKKGNNKGSEESEKQTEDKPPENSFARLFNMQTK